MNNLKKLILLSLIPAFLTIFFVIKFTIPSFNGYLKLKEQIEKENSSIKGLKNNIKILEANKTLVNKLEKLNLELTGFDVEFPSEFKDEILLIDLEIFADKTVNKILKVRALPEVEVKITDPSKPCEKNNRKSRTANNQPEKPKPATIMEKPLEINTVAYYNEIIDFVNFLEDYQRKVNIEGIYTNVFNDDKNSPNPRVELQIKGSIYKSEINKPVNVKQIKNQKSNETKELKDKKQV